MARRTDYIGGSDAASVLGQNPYKTIYDVWLEKTSGEAEDVSNFHMERGNYMEPLIEQHIRENLDPTLNSREMFDRLNIGEGNNIDQITLLHPTYPFVGGHVDGLGEAVWEMKAPTMRSFEWIVKDGISNNWIYQGQHYAWIVYARIGEAKPVKVGIWNYDLWEPYVIEFDPDLELWERMEEVYTDFWDCVEMDIPPLATTQDEYDQINVISDERLDQILADYHKWYKLRYQAEEEQGKVRAQILSTSGGRSTLQTANWRAQIGEIDKGTYKYTRLIVKPAKEGAQDDEDND